MCTIIDMTATTQPTPGAALRLVPILLVASAAFAAAPALAQKPEKPGSVKSAAADKPLPQPIQAMITHGKDVKVLARFPAPGGMTGYLMSAKGGERRIYYVTAEGTHAVLGLMLDQNLNNLTVSHLEQLGETAPPAGTAGAATKTAEAAHLDQMLALAARAPGAWTEGSGQDVFVFFDPACPFCHELYRETRPYLAHLRLHWIPVATVSNQSAGLAEVFLSSQDKASTMELLTRRAVSPAPRVSGGVAAVLSENKALMNAAGSTQVPTLLFSDGAQTRRIVGKPPVPMIEAIADLGHKHAGSR